MRRYLKKIYEKGLFFGVSLYQNSPLNPTRGDLKTCGSVGFGFAGTMKLLHKSISGGFRVLLTGKETFSQASI
jgi:hypothetical protein